MTIKQSRHTRCLAMTSLMVFLFAVAGCRSALPKLAVVDSATTQPIDPQAIEPEIQTVAHIVDDPPEDLYAPARGEDGVAASLYKFDEDDLDTGDSFDADSNTPPSLSELLKDTADDKSDEKDESDEDSVEENAESQGSDDEKLDQKKATYSPPTSDINQAMSGITLGELESLALGQHPELARAAARVAAAQGQAIQAGLPFNPVLQYQSDEIGNDDATGLHSISVSQQFVTANKLGIASQVQCQVIAKRQAQQRVAQLRVLTRVRTAFAATLVAQQRMKLTRKIAALAKQSSTAVEDLFEAEEVSRITVLQSEVEWQKAEIAAENASISFDAEKRTLAAASGLQTLPSDNVQGVLADQLDEMPWEALLDQVSAVSPELSAAGSEIERARWALQLAYAQIVPNVTGRVGVGVDTVTDDTYAMLGVSVPLPIRNRNQGNIRSQRASIAAAEADNQAIQLDLSRRLAGAVGRYQNARERFEQISRRVLPRAEETFELSRQAFEAGETDFLQLLTAQRTLFATRLSILDAAAIARKANAEIEGLLVPLEP